MPQFSAFGQNKSRQFAQDLWKRVSHKRNTKPAQFLQYILIFTIGYLVQVVRVQGIGTNFGYIDPNIYLGYANIGSALKSGIGDTYYQFRIGQIFPLRAATQFFGNDGPIILSRITAAVVPCITFYFFRNIKIRNCFSKSLILGLAIVVLSPVQGILSMTYCFGLSYVLFFLMIIHSIIAIGQISVPRYSIYVGIEVATLFSVHSFNTLYISFALGSQILFLFFAQKHRYQIRIIALYCRNILMGVFLGVLVWELVYNFHYELLPNPESFVLGNFRISSELKNLNRWDFPNYFTGIANEPRWLSISVPLIAGTVALFFLWRESRARLIDDPIIDETINTGQLLLTVTVSQTVAMLFGSVVLHSPVIGAFFYFAHTSLILVFLTTYVLISYHLRLGFVLICLFPVLAVTKPSWVFELLKPFIGLSAEAFGRFNPNDLVYLLVVFLVLGISFYSKSKISGRFMSMLVFVLWSVATLSTDNFYALNSYPQNLRDQRHFISDIKTLNRVWENYNSPSHLTAVWNEEDQYLNTLQASLVWGPTRLNGLGASNDLPLVSLDNWNCGRFWGSRGIGDSCMLNGSSLESKPTFIITTHTLIDALSPYRNIVLPLFVQNMEIQNYKFWEFGVFESKKVVYYVWKSDE